MSPSPLTLARAAMGTRFELVLIGEGDAARLRAAGEEALDEVARWHDLLSPFDKASVIARINREAAQRAVQVSLEVAELLRWCLDVTRASGGAFDIAVGHLMCAAGFRGDPPDQAATVKERNAASEGEGLPAPRFTVDPQCRVALAPGVALDLGAIGKGWAIDRAAEILRQHLGPSGLEAALLHGGTSSVTAVGGPWRIALDRGTVIDLSNESLGLSAPSGRSRTDAEGRVRGHILDPRTGESAVGPEAAAVSGPSAAVCDAWSTALIVSPSLAQAPAWPSGYLARVNTGNGFAPSASLPQPQPALAGSEGISA